MADRLIFTPVEGVGEVVAGDDLAILVASRASLRAGDVVMVTSKVVSKSLGLVSQGEKADLLREQTDRVVARRGQTVIVRTHHGLTMAGAGIDGSNTSPGTWLSLPADPDGEARRLRSRLRELTGVLVAVVITDTAGRAWRVGQTDIAIGCAGLVPVDSFSGRHDAYGNLLAVTAPAVADELASGAELASGKVGGRPFVIVRGLAPDLLCEDDGPGAAALVRPEGEDLFGLGARDAVIGALGADDDARRGFVSGVASLPDILELAGVPEGISVEADEAIVRLSCRAVDAVDAVDAGRLAQRIESLAFASGLVGVRVQVSIT